MRGRDDPSVHGDNLKVLRESIKDESVDLIYLDPPFNSNASYNVRFKGPVGAEIAAERLFDLPGFASVPRIQIVTNEQAMALRDRAVRLPARRDDGFKKAAREVDTGAQGRWSFKGLSGAVLGLLGVQRGAFP